jgi:hypothetical protein
MSSQNACLIDSGLTAWRWARRSPVTKLPADADREPGKQRRSTRAVPASLPVGLCPEQARTCSQPWSTLRNISTVSSSAAWAAGECRPMSAKPWIMPGKVRTSTGTPAPERAAA